MKEIVWKYWEDSPKYYLKRLHSVNTPHEHACTTYYAYVLLIPHRSRYEEMTRDVRCSIFMESLKQLR
jgi:hypothetical protein